MKEAQSWNRALALGQGVCVDAARHIASPRLVIPYLFIAFGGPVFLVGLLLPVTQTLRLVTPSLTWPLVASARRQKWLVTGALAAKAVALFGLALVVSDDLGQWTLVALFFTVVAIVGIGQGVNSVAYYELVGRLFSRAERRALMYRRSAAAGGFAILAIGAFGYGAFHAGMPLEGIHLLWLSAAITAAGCAFLVGLAVAEADGTVRAQSGMLPGHHAPFRPVALLRSTLSEGWFRQFAGARLLLLSVELAIPFYAIHAADIHGSGFGRLSLFIVATSLAVIVGGYVWPRYSQGEERRAMVAGACVAALAGVLAFAIDALDAMRHPGVYGLVFFLLALAMQGSGTARSLYVVAHAPVADRPRFLAAIATLSGVAAIAVAAIFGTIAHIKGAVWPIGLIVALNLAAAFWCRRLDRP